MSVSSVETVNGNVGADSVTLLAAQTSGSFNLGGGTDSLHLAAGGNTISVTGVESLIGGSGIDTVTLGATTGSMSVDLGGGIDILNLADGPSNTLSIIDADIVNGGIGSDTLKLDNAGVTLTVANIQHVVGGIGTDVVNLANGGHSVAVSGVETVNGGTGADSLQLGDSGDTVAVSAVETIFGGTLNDTVNLTGGLVAGTVDLGTGTADALYFAGNGNYTVSVANVEDIQKLDGVTGDAAVTMLTAMANGSIVLRDGANDSVVLADGGNTVSISNVEYFTGGNGNDHVTTGWYGGGTFNFGTGTTDLLTLYNGGDNIYTVSGLESVIGGAGNDTIKVGTIEATGMSFSGGGGTDILMLTSAGALTDSAFTNKSGLDELKLSNFGYTLDVGSTTLAAFGGSLVTINGSLITNNAVTVDASGLTGNLTLNLTNNSAADTVWLGTGDRGQCQSRRRQRHLEDRRGQSRRGRRLRWRRGNQRYSVLYRGRYGHDRRVGH